MPDPEFTDPPGTAGGRQEEVLALLRAAETPLSASDVAERIGLHINTARFHLDGLADSGAVTRTVERRHQPGRPRVLYTVGGQSPGPRSFALLAEMLAGLVASTEPATAAVTDTGRAWGSHLIQRPAPAQQLDSDEAADRLLRLLEAVGFQPTVSRHDAQTDIRLNHCPFREVAERHTEVVCGLHRSLIDGALDELHTPLHLQTLTPFVTETACAVTLRETR